jgi:hypothetical protein
MIGPDWVTFYVKNHKVVLERIEMQNAEGLDREKEDDGKKEKKSIKSRNMWEQRRVVIGGNPRKRSWGENRREYFSAVPDGRRHGHFPEMWQF